MYHIDISNGHATGIFREPEQQVTLHGIFNQQYSSTLTNVESVVVYTDYENIQVKYSCIELNHFWYTEKQEKVFVFVRQAALATNDKLDSTYSIRQAKKQSALRFESTRTCSE